MVRSTTSATPETGHGIHLISAYAAGGVSPSVTEMPAAFDQVADALESHHLETPMGYYAKIRKSRN